MALSLRLALSLHLRRGQGALVFAATWHPRNSTRGLHDGRFQARVQNRKVVRTDLHDSMRASGRYPRQLARPANVGSTSETGTEKEKRQRARWRDPSSEVIKPSREYLLRRCRASRNSTIPSLTIFPPSAQSFRPTQPRRLEAVSARQLSATLRCCAMAESS